MNFKPLRDNVLVRRAENETRSAGGIVIPDSASEKQNRGTVVSVGEGKRLEDGTLAPMAVAVGDEIIFTQYGGTTIKVKGEELIIVSENDILVKLDK